MESKELKDFKVSDPVLFGSILGRISSIDGEIIKFKVGAGTYTEHYSNLKVILPDKWIQVGKGVNYHPQPRCEIQLYVNELDEYDYKIVLMNVEMNKIENEFYLPPADWFVPEMMELLSNIKIEKE